MPEYLHPERESQTLTFSTVIRMPKIKMIEQLIQETLLINIIQSNWLKVWPDQAHSNGISVFFYLYYLSISKLIRELLLINESD